MRRSLLTIAFILTSMSCFGQVFRFQQFCQTGGQFVVTQGLNSTNHVQRSYPSCTVSVYATGTTNLSTIYSDALLTPLANPFTANTDGSFGFWAAPATTPSGCYDVVISGGNPGDQLSAPFTFADVCLGIGSGGGGGGVSCSTALSGSIGAFLSPTSFSCDKNMGTDFAGNGFSQSWATIGPYNGFYTLVGGAPDPGTAAKFKLPLNAVRILAPQTTTTSYYARLGGTPCTVGQVWPGQVNSVTTDGNGDTVLNLGCLTPGGGISITATSPIVVTPSPITGTGVISCPTCGSVSYPTINTPSAPTLSVGGTPGASTVTYLVQGCEDGNTCAYHTSTSATATVTNANATLSSSPITLSGYGDTLYGPRCYNVYRTVGGPSQGKVATCVGKKWIDTGGAGDGTTATNTNTTQLDALGLTSPLPGCNKIPGAPYGIDGTPCTPNALDDEFTWTSGVPGDSNTPQWIQINKGAATFTMTGGMLSLSNSAAVDALNCVFQSTPSTPYTFVALTYYSATLLGNSTANMAFRESATGKIVAVGPQLQNGSSLRFVIGKWTSATVNSTFSSGPGATPNPVYLRLSNDGTTTTYSWSSDGIVYSTLLSEAKGTFFTTGPDQVGVCLEAPAGTGVADYDYFRRTQ